MKIFVNEFHQIKEVGENNTGDDTLKEIIVEDNFLKPYCDTVIKGFCYQVNENGSTMLYPYKDFELLMSIQQLHEEKEKQVTELQLALAEMYEERQV